MSAKLTRLQVKAHSMEDDCWVIISNKIYNVTKFLAEHPGGMTILMSHAGQDATDKFNEVGHSAMAKGFMKSYCIGQVTEQDKWAEEPTTPAATTAPAVKSRSCSIL